MTQDEWEDAARNLDFKAFEAEGRLIVLAENGEIRREGVGALAWWCWDQVGLRAHTITAPEWSCMWRGGPNRELKFHCWTLGGYSGVAIVTDPEEDTKGYQKTYMIPEMPEYFCWLPDHLKDRPPEERMAWFDSPEGAVHKDFEHKFMLLALHRFAEHLRDNG